MNDRLRDVEIIGLGEVDGPEDVILDEDDNLYCSVRQGEIVRFLAPDYVRREVYAHVGGRPLGMAFDKDGGLVVCIAGMGLYRVDKQRNVHKMTAETNRSPFSIIDDSRMRLADDLDIAPDGKVYFSEATIRYGFEEWVVDALEGRGNGRIIRYDPATRRDAHDPAQSSVRQRHVHGPRQQVGAVRGDLGLPGQPLLARGSESGQDRDRDRRPSRAIPTTSIADRGGTYWVALAGTRTPSYDLAMTMPAFRRRMARRVAGDEWLFPNVNVGCVVHFDADGSVLRRFGTSAAKTIRRSPRCASIAAISISAASPTIASGGIKLADADPEWTGPASYWGERDEPARARRMDRWLGRGEASITMPPMDGAFRPNDRLDAARVVAGDAGARLLWRVTSRGLVVSSRALAASRRQAEAAPRRVLRRRDQRARRPAGRRRGGRPGRRSDRLRRRATRWRRRSPPIREMRCITALAPRERRRAARRQRLGDLTRPADWKRDLMEKNASGSVWRLDPASGARTQLAGGLAYPMASSKRAARSSSPRAGAAR